MTEDAARPGRLDYARQAEQALEMARRASTPEERAAFEEIARLWRQLADRGERR